jgi:NAD(P)-dependent dehydrogenase (short-subunit alcohol dehydrogenase family)
MAPTVISQTCLPQDLWSGQVAVVTGAGRGIGREVARALAWLGARVVIAELDESLGQEAEATIRREGGESSYVRTDVSDPGSVAALAEQIRAQWGVVSILINNAIYIREAAVSEMPLEEWDRTVAVNLRGTFLTCQAFLPGMLAQKRGTIVNMVSTDAMPGLAAYIATKQGIVGLSQSLALEVGDQGVRVIPFGPGMVDTPGIRSVARGLAPRLGLTEAQFLSVPLHPAFDGLMPAEYAGAATAYLVAVLADEFHGEVVTAYTVLERAGVIQAASIETPSMPADSAPGMPGGSADEALEMSRQLQEIIAQTGAEFNRLPVFVRPIARSGFKSKAGQSLQDWSRTATALTAHLAQGAPSPDPARLAALFDKLVTYYEGVPAETARFTKDAETLCQVTQLSQDRIVLIRALGALLAQARAE